MTINHDHLLNYPIPEIRQTIRWQDTALYNFSIGLGQDPMDQAQLDFLYEPRLKAMPSMAVVLGYPGFWIRNPDTGVDWTQVLHGEQSIILHKPLPAEGEIIGRSRITSIVDRGAGKGAMLYNERVVTDAKTGEKLATLEGTTFARGDGGFGGPTGPIKRPHPEPDRAPDLTVDLRDAARAGDRLSAERRPQPAAHRPGGRRQGRLQAADPARALHLRRGLPRADEGAVRLRPGALRADGSALLLPGVSRARRSAPRSGTRMAARPSARASWSATRWWSATGCSAMRGRA